MDVGCGGGINIKNIAQRASNGKVYGIDYSEESIKISEKTNQELIASGKVEIQFASVSDLPFMENTFDLITGCETYFFWPDLTQSLGEIKRVLKPGGTLVLTAAQYISSNEKYARQTNKYAKIGNYSIHSPNKLVQIIEDAGFIEVNYQEGLKNTVLFVSAKKPQ